MIFPDNPFEFVVKIFVDKDTITFEEHKLQMFYADAAKGQRTLQIAKIHGCGDCDVELSPEWFRIKELKPIGDMGVVALRFNGEDFSKKLAEDRRLLRKQKLEDVDSLYDAIMSRAMIELIIRREGDDKRFASIFLKLRHALIRKPS